MKGEKGKYEGSVRVWPVCVYGCMWVRTCHGSSGPKVNLKSPIAPRCTVGVEPPLPVWSGSTLVLVIIANSLGLRSALAPPIRSC
jgi:hypothetical protein